jgi:hypothetical protein
VQDRLGKEEYEVYQKKNSELQRSFIILVGFGLFFLFMILLPFYSLKNDSTMINSIEWLNQNVSQILLSMDEVLNSSKIINSNIQRYIDSNTQPINEIQKYSNDLNSIRYFNQTLGMSTENGLIQNKISNIVIYANCVENSIINEWVDCNLKEAISKIATNMHNQFNRTATNIDENLLRINNAVNKINEINKKIVDQSISTSYPDDVQALFYRTSVLIKNTSENLTEMNEKLQSTAKIRPSSPLDFYLVYPTGQVYGFDALKLVIVKILSSDERDKIQNLKNELDRIKAGINDEIDKLEDRFDRFQSPFGNVPIGFNEAIGVFPLALSAGFIVFAYRLIEQQNFLTSSGYNESISTIWWYDPHRTKREQIAQIFLLFVPSIIFMVSFTLVIQILFFFDDPFPYAIVINQYLFLVLSITGLIFFVWGYLRIFRWKFFGKTGLKSK